MSNRIVILKHPTAISKPKYRTLSDNESIIIFRSKKTDKPKRTTESISNRYKIIQTKR